jgi:hypothetical protein
MDVSFDLDALALTGGRVLYLATTTATLGHDIPHPIGDPDEDEGLPDQDDDEEDEDDEEEEEPLQV